MASQLSAVRSSAFDSRSAPSSPARCRSTVYHCCDNPLVDIVGDYAPVGLIVSLVVIASVVAAAFAVPGMRANDTGRAVRGASRALLAGSLLAILILTLSGSGGAGGVNLVPFRGIIGQLGNVNSRLGGLNLAGNVLMYVPMGLLAPSALRWGVGRVTAAAFTLSATIECTQRALGRSSDVDDVILNTLGALVGAVIAYSLIVLTRRRAQRAIREPSRRPRATAAGSCT
jgi:hypothetical protein